MFHCLKVDGLITGRGGGLLTAINATLLPVTKKEFCRKNIQLIKLSKTKAMRLIK